VLHQEISNDSAKIKNKRSVVKKIIILMIGIGSIGQQFAGNELPLSPSKRKRAFYAEEKDRGVRSKTTKRVSFAPATTTEVVPLYRERKDLFFKASIGSLLGQLEDIMARWINTVDKKMAIESIDGQPQGRIIEYFFASLNKEVAKLTDINSIAKEQLEAELKALAKAMWRVEGYISIYNQNDRAQRPMEKLIIDLEDTLEVVQETMDNLGLR
jgi:hypothetical protein